MSKGVMVDEMRNWWGSVLVEEEGGVGSVSVGSVGSDGILHVKRP